MAAPDLRMTPHHTERKFDPNVDAHFDALQVADRITRLNLLIAKLEEQHQVGEIRSLMGLLEGLQSKIGNRTTKKTLEHLNTQLKLYKVPELTELK